MPARIDPLVNCEKLGSSSSARDVAWGQIGFAVFIGVCVVLHPGFVLKANEGGISDYGVHAKTLAPYTLALGLPGVLTYLAARRLPVVSPDARRLRAVLFAYAALITLTLLSTYPYTLNRMLADVHIAVGAVVTVFESGASLWMYRAVRRYATVLVAQLVGLVLGWLTIIGVLHVLFASEMISGVAFAYLLVRTTQLES
ncbi:MAG: hypothetical protein WA614_07880 [Acidimicrobiales bacterium]